mmetsp:Transcript_37720/g.90172  ORF Transcript_37720/g.90172 Transcript_37720/m.90172 type:complete len:438 (-) Transcript_37720:1559-2872(-)
MLFLVLGAEKGVEHGLGVLRKLLGAPELRHLAVAEDQHAVPAQDRVDTVGNRDGGQLLCPNLRLQDLLNHLVRGVVHTRGGLVQHKHLGLPQQGAGAAQQLALAHRKVLTPSADEVPETLLLRLEVGLQLHLVQLLPELSIAELPERVQVEAHGSAEAHRVLRDDGKGPAQLREPHAGDVHAIQQHRARLQRAHPEERLQQGALSRAGAAHHPQRRAPRQLEAEALQHQRQLLPVAHLHVFEAQAALGEGEALTRQLQSAFVLEVGVGCQPLYRDQALLRHGQVAQDALHGVPQLLGVAQRHARGGARELTPQRAQKLVEHHQQRHHRGHEAPQKLQAKGQPLLAARLGKVQAKGPYDPPLVLTQEEALLLVGPNSGHPYDGLVHALVDGALGLRRQPLDLPRRLAVDLLDEIVRDQSRKKKQEDEWQHHANHQNAG